MCSLDWMHFFDQMAFVMYFHFRLNQVCKVSILFEEKVSSDLLTDLLIRCNQL